MDVDFSAWSKDESNDHLVRWIETLPDRRSWFLDQWRPQEDLVGAALVADAYRFAIENVKRVPETPSGERLPEWCVPGGRADTPEPIELDVRSAWLVDGLLAWLTSALMPVWPSCEWWVYRNERLKNTDGFHNVWALGNRDAFVYVSYLCAWTGTWRDLPTDERAARAADLILETVASARSDAGLPSFSPNAIAVEPSAGAVAATSHGNLPDDAVAEVNVEAWGSVGFDWVIFLDDETAVEQEVLVEEFVAALRASPGAREVLHQDREQILVAGFASADELRTWAKDWWSMHGD